MIFKSGRSVKTLTHGGIVRSGKDFRRFRNKRNPRMIFCLNADRSGKTGTQKVHEYNVKTALFLSKSAV